MLFRSWVKTVATCEQALTLAKLSPKDREAWLTRQVMATLDGLGDVETARETCQTWLETASSTQEPLRVMAAIERKRADWESLDEVLEQRIAVLTDPLQRSELLVERAHVALHERARHTLAVSYAKAASELIPFEADAEGLLVLLDELVQLSETRADAAVLRAEPGDPRRKRCRHHHPLLHHLTTSKKSTTAAANPTATTTMTMSITAATNTAATTAATTAAATTSSFRGTSCVDPKSLDG